MRTSISSTSVLSFSSKKLVPILDKAYLFQAHNQVLEFVDMHGNEVLNLGSFTLLPQHVVRLILAREQMKADEFSKFQV